MNFITLLDYVGTFAFAISGIRLASAKHFDWFGAYVVGFVTAVGGGTLRDLLLGLPPFWMQNVSYLVVSGFAFLFVVGLRKYVIRLNNTFFIFDAVGLGLFTVVGIQKSIAVGYPMWVGIIMGTLTGAASFTKPAMIVALDANGEVVSETNLPEQIELRTGTASPTVQMCASFTQPHLYFIGKQDFSAYEAMRYNYETGKVNWDYITADLDADHSGGDIIYGYMGVHPTTEQLWVGKSTYTQSAVHVYDVSRSDALEFSSFYQKKASPAGVDFAYRFSDEWINK